MNGWRAEGKIYWRSVTLTGFAMMLLAHPGSLSGQGAGVIASASAGVGLRAGTDSITVAVGPGYQAGLVRRLLLGDGYRELWTTAVRVPLLQPEVEGGGLTLLREGNGRQTASLLFLGGDQVEYVFRSADKTQGDALPDDFRGTLIAWIVQDLVSAKHPGSAVITGGLLDAVGVPHPGPRLRVMADHPILGDHREKFAHLPGMIEEHPEAEPPVGSRFRNLSRTIDSEELFRRLDQSMEDQVDERAYLAVRLMDLLVGDWDRHPDQWRWGLIAERDLQSPGAPRVWVPIPRDRDNAFSDVGGLVSHLANYFAPSMVQFRGEYPDLYRLVQNAAVLDRRILSPIPYDLWDEVALELRDQLTDAAISDAIAGLPVEWETLEREPLEARLRVRRDALPEVARQLRTMMVSEVEIYGTGEDDEARIERRPDGSVRVSLLATQHGGAVYFDRVFQPAHTRELRIHLGAGNDRAVVTGKGNEVTVRVLGGPGDDWFEDLSVTETPARTLFYDHEGDDHFAGSVTGKTLVDRRQPSSQRGDHPVFHSNAPPPRDWGARFTPLVPRIKWRSQIGPVVGAGPRWEEFGFRRQPEARRLDLAALYAPLHNRFGVEAEARWPRARVGESVRVSAYGSAINVTRFHGFGNDSPSADQVVDPLVWSTNYGFSAVAVEEGERGFEFSIGPAVHYLRPDAGSGSPASLEEGRGGDPFGVAGVEGAVVLDRRDSSSYPRRGVRMNLTAEGFPVAWGGVENGFASASIAGAAYLPIPAPGEMTLAVRAGAAAAGRNTPFQFAPALGGSSTLRGFHTHRFTGDGMLYWGAELRAYLMRGNLRFVKGEIGAIGLLDAGRVTGSIGSSAGWHYGKGGGLWFGVLDRSLTVHLVYARGERGGLYAGLGMPF